MHKTLFQLYFFTTENGYESSILNYCDRFYPYVPRSHDLMEIDEKLYSVISIRWVVDKDAGTETASLVKIHLSYLCEASDA